MTSAQPSRHVSPLAVITTLAGRELVRFFRQRNRVFGALGQPIIFWLLFGKGLEQAAVPGAGGAEGSRLGFAHFFPGTLVMILLFTSIFATISIIEDRREGFLQSVLVAPIARWAMVLGKVLGGAAIAIVQGLIFLGLGWFTPGLSSSAIQILQAVLLMSVVAVALTALGFTLAWRMDSTQGFHAIMSVFLFPMWLLSGAFFPQDQGVLAWIAWINPLSYGVAGLRRLLEFSSETAAVSANTPSLAVCWAVSLLFAAVMLAAACRIAATRTTGDLQ